MKNFFKHTFFLLLALLIAAVVLDIIFTKVISSSSDRNKIENVINSSNKNFDVVIMGTSRANNHFVPKIFEDKGLKTFNYGMSGAHLFETSLLLKLMIERNFKIKNILLEADLSICNDKRDEGNTARFMPFIHQNNTIKNHFKSQDDYYQLYYLPFYRYIKFSNKIGLREFNAIIGKKPSNVLHNKGYYPLFTTQSGKMKNDISPLKPIKNKYYEEIKQICKKNKIKLTVVMTPMCSNTKGLEYFEKVNKLYPEINNFENVITDDNYFSSCGHLNDKGAKLYTNIVIEKCFSK